MDIYQSIIEFNKQEAKNYVKEQSKKDFFFAIRSIFSGNKYAEATELQTEAILKAIQESDNNPLDDAKLSELVKKFYQIDAKISGKVGPNEEKIKSLRKEWIKEKSAFYLKLIEGNESSSYEEAAKSTFKNKSDYKKAIEPSITIEKEMNLNLRLKYKRVNTKIKEFENTLEDVRNKKISEIYSK